MKKLLLIIPIVVVLFSSCGVNKSKKRSLDDTLFKYASIMRWSRYDDAVRFLKPGSENMPTNFELQKLKQFKVSGYLESPISPGDEAHVIIQNVEIQLYNIHNNKTKTIYDLQYWEYDDEIKRWLLTSGLPKL